MAKGQNKPKTNNKPKLTIEALCAEAAAFAEVESSYPEPSMYGVTDGKAVGTYLEHKFQAFLQIKYSFTPCNSAQGVDFPDLEVDMKVTSITQPQYKRVIDMADTQMNEMGGADAQLGEAGRIRRAALPSREIMLDVEDEAARVAGARGEGQSEARGSAQVARGGRHDLMHRLAGQAAAQRGVDGCHAQGDR